MTIQNDLNAQFAFKVKTTQPRRYIVRPNQGLIDAGKAVNISFTMNPKDCDDLIKEGLEDSGDKFLVQNIQVTANFFDRVVVKSAKEQSDELTDMWNTSNKRDIVSQKLRCRFAFSLAESADAPSETLSRSIRQEQVKEILHRSTGVSDAPPEAQGGVDLSDMAETIANLHKQYDELLAFSVQQSTERASLSDALASARQNEQLLTEELKRAQSRENGARKSATEQASFSPPPESPAIWKIMFMVIFAFFAGRLIG